MTAKARKAQAHARKVIRLGKRRKKLLETLYKQQHRCAKARSTVLACEQRMATTQRKLADIERELQKG